MANQNAGGEPSTILTYSRRIHAPGIASEIQFSADMSTWTAEPENLEQVSVAPNADGVTELSASRRSQTFVSVAPNADGVTESVTMRLLPAVSDPASRHRLFRLHVTANPIP